MTATMCGDPVRDLRHVTPIVTGVSMSLAILAVGMRMLDAFRRDYLLDWSNIAIVLALVSTLMPQFAPGKREGGPGSVSRHSFFDLVSSTRPGTSSR